MTNFQLVLNWCILSVFCNNHKEIFSKSDKNFSVIFCWYFPKIYLFVLVIFKFNSALADMLGQS